MVKPVVKEGFITSDADCYSGLVICPWKGGMTPNSTCEYKYRTDFNFYTLEMEDIFGFTVPSCHVQKVRLTYLPRGKGFELKCVGKSYKPKFSS